VGQGFSPACLCREVTHVGQGFSPACLHRGVTHVGQAFSPAYLYREVTHVGQGFSLHVQGGRRGPPAASGTDREPIRRAAMHAAGEHA
jgi:hypothetical protein